MSAPPHITLLHAALLVLLNVALAANVTRMRWREKVGLMGEPTRPLRRAQRAHGNNAEYAALAIVLLLVLELGGARPLTLHAVGGSFTLGRFLHAAGVLGKIGWLQVAGSTLTYAPLAAMGGVGLALWASH